MGLTTRATRATMAHTKKAASREQADLIKCVVDRIESALDSMKSESLIVDQNATVNTFPGLVHTARHTMGVGCKRSR